MGLLNVSIVFLCVCGIALSLYAIYIAKAKDMDRNFQASCDLDETISCTHALMSDYSKGFGIVGSVLGKDHPLNLPNSYMGVIFFPILALLALSSSRLLLMLALLLCLVSTVVSAYLIYVLVYVLETICIVCLPIHLINILTFLLFTAKWRTSSNDTTQRLKKD